MNRTFNYALAALIVCLATATGCEQIRELRGMPVQTVSNAGANPFGGAPAVEIPPDAKAMGAFLVAEYASDEGDHEAALKGYEDAVAADPTNSTLRVRLATLYVRDGRLKEALTQVNEALKNNPDSVDARLLAAESAARSATTRPPRRTTSRSCRKARRIRKRTCISARYTPSRAISTKPSRPFSI